MTGAGSDEFVELRVHGVAGTPPASLLGLEEVPVDPAPTPCGRVRAKVGVQTYRPPELSEDLRGMSWSSFTSGRRSDALWILLLPYMLANLAGWAAVPFDAKPADGVTTFRSGLIRRNTFVVRLAGVLVTVLMSFFAALAIADLLMYQRVADRTGGGWIPAVGMFLAAVTMLFIFWFTRLRLRPGAPSPWKDARDPVGYGNLHQTQPVMWNSPGIIVRLRRLHLAAAWGSLALLAALMRPSVPPFWTTLDVATAVLAVVASAVPLLLLAAITLSDGRDLSRLDFWVRWGCVVLAAAALAVSVWRLGTMPDASLFGAHLPNIRFSGIWFAIGFFLLALVARISAARGVKEQVPEYAPANQMALILNAATVATIFGAGGAIQVQRLLGDRRCRSIESARVGDCNLVVGSLIDWLAAGFTWLLILLMWGLLIRFAVVWRRTNGPQRVPKAIVKFVENPSVILRMLSVNGIVGLAVALAIGIPTGFPSLGSLPSWFTIGSTAALLGPPVVFVLAKAWSLGGKRKFAALVLVAAVAAGLVWVLQTGRSFGFAGFRLPPGSFLELAQLVTLVLPFTLIIGKLRGAWKSREVRKGVGILWDLGAFWPRWFHPFTPPTYSDSVVTNLTARIEERLAADKPILLAPHSQGTVIAAAAILALDQPTKRLALLTYGSPLSHLYAQGFPAVFSRDCLATLCNKLSTDGGKLRWRNLYRVTDPIGGRIDFEPPGKPAGLEEALAGVDLEMQDPCGRGHSWYPIEPEYTTCAAELRGMIGAPVPRAQWDGSRRLPARASAER